jgi:hypothetical protein
VIGVSSSNTASVTFALRPRADDARSDVWMNGLPLPASAPSRHRPRRDGRRLAALTTASAALRRLRQGSRSSSVPQRLDADRADGIGLVLRTNQPRHLMPAR